MRIYGEVKGVFWKNFFERVCGIYGAACGMCVVLALFVLRMSAKFFEAFFVD